MRCYELAPLVAELGVPLPLGGFVAACCVQVIEAPFRQRLAFLVCCADIGGFALGLHPELYL